MRALHVLIVDDSAVVRQVLADLLRREPGFVVSAAADPFIALDKMRQQRPDVLLLDLELPRMDGLTFLAKLMAEDPLPVVVCSGVAQRGTEAALRALSGGALDVVPKPSLGVRSFLEESAVMLADTLRAAAQARPRRLAPPPQPAPARPAPTLGRTTDQVVAVGASTGGTEALRALLGSLPPDSPGLVIVQHMPAVFTATFAQGLNRSTALEVKEAEDGDRLLEGRALIAPGNRHTELVRSGGHYAVRVFDGPLVSRHRPSVDVLFGSVARAAGANAVGLIMTGMGDDGARGLLEMRQAGAATLAQDEGSCVVFGMPREAIRAGAVEVVAPLHELGPRLLAEARRRRVA